MSTKPVRPDNSIKLVVGHVYLLTPQYGGNYVRIIALTRKYAYFEGVDNTIADWKLPVWKADDVLVKDLGAKAGPSSSFLLLMGGGYLLKADGGKLRLNV